MRQPSRALLVGLVFFVIGIVYWFVSYEPVGTAALVALGIAMGVMAYALASAAPDETDAGGSAGTPDAHGSGGSGQHGMHG